MNDQIIIEQIRCHGILGINPAERVSKQEIVIDLSLETDTRPAAASNSIEDTVDYFEVATKVKEFVEGREAHLVETLVNEVADLVLDHYSGVSAVTVRVEKPNAIEFAQSVGIEVMRQRMPVGLRGT